MEGVTASGVSPDRQGLLAISDVVDLQQSLDEKSDVGHRHDITEISPEPLAANANLDGGTFY